MKIQRRFKELESVPASSAQKKRRVRKEIIPSNGKKRRGDEMDIRDIGQQYGHLVRRSFQGVLIAEGFPPKILFANDALARISGYSVDELLKFTIKKLRAMIHPDDRDLFLRRYRDRLSNKKVPSHDEFRMIRGDGSAVWVEMFFSRIMINGTTLIEATIIDITERKNAEEQLRQSEEKYRAIIDNIQDGYYEVGLAGNFTFFNDAITSILGYSRNELRGVNNRLFMAEANAKKVYQTFNRAHRTYRSERAFDWEIIRKDGSRRIVEASASLIRDAAGGPVGFRGIVRGGRAK